MHSRIPWKSVLLLFVLIQPPALLAQSKRQAPPTRPDPPALRPSPDPRELRAAREQAVAVVGTTGRDFVEIYGEDAVAAIFACSQEKAKQLVEFHSSGRLGKLPRPRDLLRVIGKPNHGDEVASWAITHADELTVADNFDAYLIDPLSYALALKKLEDGAAEVREFRRRMHAYQAQMAESRSSYGWRMFLLGVGATGAALLLAWRFRQYRAQNSTGL